VKNLKLLLCAFDDGFNKKIVAYDKALESLSIKIDSLSSALKNQLSFNKMIETQLVQLAALVPSAEEGKIPGQPVSSCEDVCVVFTRWGKPSMRTQPTDNAGKPVE
jgi:hypothetical protein